LSLDLQPPRTQSGAWRLLFFDPDRERESLKAEAKRHMLPDGSTKQVGLMAKRYTIDKAMRDVATEDEAERLSLRCLVRRMGAAKLKLNGEPAQPSPPEPTTISTAAGLGHLIKAARLRQKFTQQQFADLTGVGRRFLSELENGKPSLEFNKVIQVANAAGIDLFARSRS
jgi:y4mF family transcriptional regulator